MSKNIVVVAPHADDETLGCGGTILRHIEEGDNVFWLIITQMNENDGYSLKQVQKRESEVKLVSQTYGFTLTKCLGFSPAKLDTIPMGTMVGSLGSVFKEIQPQIVYLPYPGDIHTDHRVVFDAVTSCTKSFRYPTIKKVMVYETLSETEFGLNPDHNGFRPNVFVDISNFLERKIKIMNIFESEVGGFPFPRSEQAIRALATLRGSSAGCQAAEAFMLLKEII